MVEQRAGASQPGGGSSRFDSVPMALFALRRRSATLLLQPNPLPPTAPAPSCTSAPADHPDPHPAQLTPGPSLQPPPRLPPRPSPPLRRAHHALLHAKVSRGRRPRHGPGQADCRCVVPAGRVVVVELDEEQRTGELTPFFVVRCAWLVVVRSWSASSRDGCLRQARASPPSRSYPPAPLLPKLTLPCPSPSPLRPSAAQLEYDNIEGMILLSELSRRRIRSIQKLIRVGRNEVVVVLRVDKEKGAFDSSGLGLQVAGQVERGGGARRAGGGRLVWAVGGAGGRDAVLGREGLRELVASRAGGRSGGRSRRRQHSRRLSGQSAAAAGRSGSPWRDERAQRPAQVGAGQGRALGVRVERSEQVSLCVRTTPADSLAVGPPCVSVPSSCHQQAT